MIPLVCNDTPLVGEETRRGDEREGGGEREREELEERRGDGERERKEMRVGEERTAEGGERG